MALDGIKNSNWSHISTTAVQALWTVHWMHSLFYLKEDHCTVAQQQLPAFPTEVPAEHYLSQDRMKQGKMV